MQGGVTARLDLVGLVQSGVGEIPLRSTALSTTGVHVFKFIVIAVIVLLVLWAVGMYNGLIKLRNLVQEAWRQIDVELKRRHDLIPNLVETVKGYAAHEKGTLEGVMQARSAAMSGGQTPAAAAQSEGMLSQALALSCSGRSLTAGHG